MLRSQTLAIEADKINAELTELRAEFRRGGVETRAEDGTDTEQYREWQGKVDAAEKRLGESVARRHEAMEAEDREVDERRAAGDTGGWDAEQRDFIQLEQRASLGGFLQHTVLERSLKGAEDEFAKAIRGADVDLYDRAVPWALFLDPEKLTEVRAIGTPSAITSMQDPIIREVFSASTAAFLGTRYSSAGIGDALIPVLTAATADIVAKDASIAAGGSIAVTTLTPKRFAVRYEIARQDMLRVRGLESTVRADMLPAVMDHLDHQTINGGASGSVTGGILNALTAVTAQAAVATWATGLGRISAGIDGQYARSLKQLKSVIGAGGMAFMYGLVASNTAVPLASYLMMESGGLMSTGNMPNTGANRAIIVCKTGPGMMYNGVGKVWGGGLEVIRDEKSQSAKDEVAITAAAYYDYSVTRTAGFLETDLKIA